ncbi:DUF3179 domain-containing (seleno)protein [Streptomyces griseoincarnatus]
MRAAARARIPGDREVPGERSAVPPPTAPAGTQGRGRDRGSRCPAGGRGRDRLADPRRPAGSGDGRAAGPGPVPGGARRCRRSGGPGKDGIPSIDKPRFVPANKAGFLDDEDPVFGLEYRGEVRAYPQLVLVWLEIVNGTVAGEPLAVTYCPLTGTVMDVPVDRLRHMTFAYPTFHRALEDALADLGPGH